MGYAPAYFEAHIAAWMQNGWLPPHGRLMEFGSQEFHGDHDRARASTETFLRSCGVDERVIAETLPPGEPISVAKVYRAVDIDYVSIDVDGSRGSEYFDLNTFSTPDEWRESFDFINNEGTIEHLVNPINGFQVAHELLKVYGVIVHSIPLSGWFDHGLFHPTVKFYAALQGTNSYELLQANVLISEEKLDVCDPRFGIVDINGQKIKNIESVKYTHAWLKVAFRKTSANEFKVPFDHLEVDQPDELGLQLINNLGAYSRSRLTRDSR